MTDYLLGLEWLETYLKIACFRVDGKKFQLHQLDQLDIPRDDPDEAIRILQGWAEKNLDEKNQVEVVLTLPESSIFLKELELPKTKIKGLSEALFWEISSVVPFSPVDAVIQWKKISEKEKTVNLGAIVAKNEIVENLSTIIRKSGFRLIAIEPSSLAFSRLSQVPLKKNSLLVIAEEPETNFVVLKNDTPVFSSAVPINLVGMKAQKRKLGQTVNLQLSTNAKRVISFWENKEKDKIFQVIVTGQGVRYSGLAKAINQLVHLPTTFGRLKKIPKVKISGYPQAVIGRYLVPLGASLKPLLADSSKEVNLLPKAESQVLEKEKSQRKMAKKIFLLAKITALFLLINLLIFAGLKFWLSSIEKKVAQAKIFVERHPAQEKISEIKKANQLLSQVANLMANQRDSGERLRQIGQLTPTNLNFNSLEFNSQKQEWQITGIGDRQDILAFWEKLKADSGATLVTMPYSNLEKEKQADFKIILKW